MDWREGWRVAADPLSGLARAETIPGPKCPHCGGAGRREMQIDGVWRVGKCRCQMVVDRVALFNAAGIPARHHDSTIENFSTDADLRDGEPAKKTVRMWLDRYRSGGEARGFVLEGQPGRGKTHLLCGAVRELVFRYGVPVKFIEFTHLLSRIREGIDRGDGDATTLTPLIQVPVLAIDELGKGRKTDWELAIIDEIVTRRYNTGGVLLGTTNFRCRADSAKETEDRRLARERGASLALAVVERLEDRLGERVFSRMRETVDFREVAGRDYRARGAMGR